MIRIIDIAKKAEVSTATVSYVLNRKECAVPISEETRKRVAKELDYHPNILARSLAQGKSNTLGLVLPSITHPFFTQVMKGVENTATEEGYSVIICDTQENVDKETLHLNILKRRWVDGER